MRKTQILISRDINDWFGGERSRKATTKSAINSKPLDGIMADFKRGFPPARVQETISRIGNDYGRALTITFTDHCIFKYSEKYLMSAVEQEIKATRNINHYCFVNDMSENGRFHLHGSITFKDLKAITNLRRRLSKFGITKIKIIDTADNWGMYCLKQYSEEGKHNVRMSPLDLMVISNCL